MSISDVGAAAIVVKAVFSRGHKRKSLLRVIDPRKSNFILVWDLLALVALLYTAMISPCVLTPLPTHRPP